MKISLFVSGECVRQCVDDRGSFLRFMSLPVLLALLFCLLSADLIFADSERYSALAFEASVPGSSSPSAITGDTTPGLDDADAISRALKNAIATEPKAPFSDGVAPTSLITQEIRYEMPEAGEVDLWWWVDGWHILPEGKRPPGTVVKDGSMFTPMTRGGNIFITRVEVPVGTVINYLFHITKTSTNLDVDVWDTTGYPPHPYQTIARAGRPAVVLATLDLDKAQSKAKRTYAPLVTMEIRYRSDRSTDVSLVWGINGWETVSEDIRPVGTVLKDKRMHTPMVRKDNTFITKVQVPAGAILDYNFLITETNNSATTQIWEAAEAFRQTVTMDGSIDVNAKVESAMQKVVQSESSENASDNSGVTQGVRHYWIHGGEIVLAALLALAVLALLKAFVFPQKSRSQ